MNEAYTDLANNLGIYLLNEDQIPLAAECNAEAYEGYELYDILFKNHCDFSCCHLFVKFSIFDPKVK